MIIEDRQNTSGWRMVFDYFKKEPRLVRLQKLVKQGLREKVAKEKKGSSMRNSSVKAQPPRVSNNANQNNAALEADIAAMRKAAANVNKASKLETDLQLLIKEQENNEY